MNKLPIWNQMNHCLRILKHFWKRVNISEGCWYWNGNMDKDNYGVFAYRDNYGVSRKVRAHRFMYESYNGPIPKGKLILHSCDNPSCVNPNHLKCGTTQDNVNDKVLKSRAKGAHSGMKHHNCKFSDGLIQEILRDVELGKYNRISDIVDELGIAYQTMRDILIGRIRKNATKNYDLPKLKAMLTVRHI